jgi:hypothetical protein
MLDDDDGCAHCARLTGNQVDALDNALSFEGSVLSGAQGFLDIYDEESSSH